MENSREIDVVVVFRSVLLILSSCFRFLKILGLRYENTKNRPMNLVLELSTSSLMPSWKNNTRPKVDLVGKLARDRCSGVFYVCFVDIVIVVRF